MAAKTALDRIKKQIAKLRRDPIGSVGDATSAVLDHLQQLGEHQLSLLDAQSSKLAMMIESKTGLPEAATRKLHDMQQAVSQSLSSAREALMHIGEARGQVSRLIGDAAETLSQSPLGKVPPARSALSKVRKLAGETAPPEAMPKPLREASMGGHSAAPTLTPPAPPPAAKPGASAKPVTEAKPKSKSAAAPAAKPKPAPKPKPKPAAAAAGAAPGQPQASAEPAAGPAAPPVAKTPAAKAARPAKSPAAAADGPAAQSSNGPSSAPAAAPAVAPEAPATAVEPLAPTPEQEAKLAETNAKRARAFAQSRAAKKRPNGTLDNSDT